MYLLEEFTIQCYTRKSIFLEEKYILNMHNRGEMLPKTTTYPVLRMPKVVDLPANDLIFFRGKFNHNSFYLTEVSMSRLAEQCTASN